MTSNSRTRRTITCSGLGLALTCLTLAACGSPDETAPVAAGMAAPQSDVLEDVVVPDTHDFFLAGANGVELSTPLSVADVAAFYEDHMPSKGWTLAVPVTPGRDSAVMYFEQKDRKATVHIRRPPGRDATLVQVLLG